VIVDGIGIKDSWEEYIEKLMNNRSFLSICMLHLVSGTNSRILFVKLVLRDKQEFLCLHYINFCEREMNKKQVEKNADTVVN